MKYGFTLLVLCFCYACKKDSNDTAFSNYVKYMYSDTTNLLANDTATFTVQITTIGAQDSTYFTAVFPAAGGKILNADASGNVYILNNSASLQVQVTQAPGLYPLTLQYETNKLSFVQTNILTRPALPDYLLLEPAALYIDTTALSPVAFSVVPKRYQGMVSTGYSVSAKAFYLVNGDSVFVNHFTGLANNVLTNGQISVSFLPDKANNHLAPPVYVIFYSITNADTLTQAVYPLYYK